MMLTKLWWFVEANLVFSPCSTNTCRGRREKNDNNTLLVIKQSSIVVSVQMYMYM